jgi:hypothetical protein
VELGWRVILEGRDSAGRRREDDRRAEKLGGVALFVAVDEPGLVRGVFEEAPHEVGHARDDLAGGDVDTRSIAERLNGFTEAFGHAVEHLEFDVLVAKPCALHSNEGVGEAAGIVCAEGRAEVGVGLDEEAGAVLVVEVGGGLLCEDGNVVAFLRGDDRFLVPVSALHETDGEGRAPPFGQGAEADDVIGGVLEVGLDDNADILPVAEVGRETAPAKMWWVRSL